AGTGARGGDGHPDDQCAEGLRPRLHHRPERHPVRRERAGAGALSLLLRHLGQPGPGQRHRGDPLPARGAGDGCQYPPPAEGVPTVTTASPQRPGAELSTPTSAATPPKRSLVSRITGFTGHWAV